MNTQSNPQKVNINLYDFIPFNPSTILNIFYQPQQSRIYISRQKYSEIYEVSTKESNYTPVLQQIAEFEPSLYFLSIDGLLALFKPFQLKIFRNSKWQHHSFTTQLLSIRVVNNTVYSFHQKETIAWNFEEEYFTFKHVGELSTPYHIDAEGSLTGLGKKVKQVNKGANFTRCEVIEKKWVLVGDDKGSLHVYDWKFLSHLKTFHEHEAAILTIKVANANTVYFSGSDSKISVAKLIGQEWQLGQSIRGQSHDIFALQVLENTLISGGVTTDLCFYNQSNGEFTGEFQHKVSYCGVNRTSNEGKYVVVNNRSNFQIWQIGLNINRTNLVAKYQMPAQKFIIDCKLYKEELEEKTYLLLVITDEDAIGWKFNTETGLSKYITIRNQYQLVDLMPKHVFLGVRNDGLLQKVNCKNGKIQQLTYCEVELPTDIKNLGQGCILVGSKISKVINIINIRKQQMVKQLRMNQTYTYFDQLDQQSLILQYFNNPHIYKFTLEGQVQKELVKLPINMIRFGGWITSVTGLGNKQVKSKVKKYWYGVSEGKIVIVSNLLKDKNKKIRVRQTERIAQVFKPSAKVLGCNLAVIPYQFSKMIDQLPIKPVFTKKIV